MCATGPERADRGKIVDENLISNPIVEEARAWAHLPGTRGGPAGLRIRAPAREGTPDRPVIGLWVAIGGAIGAAARFGIGGWITTWAFAGYPWGTFAVNVVGSAALGFLHRALPAPGVSPHTRAFFMSGLCGGFTTFSTFDFELLSLLQTGQPALAATYALASVLTCIVGVACGIALASTVVTRRS